MTSTSVRPAAVAGLFYPDRPERLRADVDALLARAASAHRPSARRPKALVVPHAGYVYSGPVAAEAYRLLRGAVPPYRRVVILGPAHRVFVRGLASAGADAFATPLGEVLVDRQSEREVSLLADRPDAHAREHSLEVQLPFLQRVLEPGFSIVPIAVGDAPVHEVAAALDALWGGDETLIVISTDLSHFLPYEVARRVDAETVRQILAGASDGPIDHEQACGATPLNAFLEVARRRGLEGELVDLRSSGDTAGSRGEVVGYAAFAYYAGGGGAREGREPFADDESPPADASGAKLLHLARRSIEQALGGPPISVPSEPWLHERAATFVTIHRGDRLHGCVGSIEAHRPLWRDVCENAVAAATRDPRSRPLREDELPAARIQVSQLSPLSPITFTSERDALAQLRPHVDGIVVSYGVRRATFLPQVWEQLPAPRDFLRELKMKAGLDADFWSPKLDLSRYTLVKWTEEAA